MVTWLSNGQKVCLPSFYQHNLFQTAVLSLARVESLNIFVTFVVAKKLCQLLEVDWPQMAVSRRPNPWLGSELLPGKKTGRVGSSSEVLVMVRTLDTGPTAEEI